MFLGMKQFVTADRPWDVYTIGTAMRAFFRETFADKLRLGDGGLHGHQVRTPPGRFYRRG